MLILNRSEGESVVIGDNVKLTVIRVLRDSVIIGFDAPKDVVIDREEIRRRKDQSQRERSED